MHSFQTEDLGDYRGDTYLFCGFVKPEPTGSGFDPDADAHHWGVTVAQKRADHSNRQIVRLDNAHGQDPHIDKVYLPPDSTKDRKQVLSGAWPYSKMKAYVLSTWREFADRYIYYNE